MKHEDLHHHVRPWSNFAFSPGDEGCDHTDHSEDSNADSPDTDSGSFHSDSS